jgi:hypothetical protein
MEIIYNEEMESAISFVQSQLPRLGNFRALDDFLDDREEGEEYEPTEVTLTIQDMDSAVIILGKQIGKRSKLLKDPTLYESVLPRLHSYNLLFSVMIEALAKGESLTFIEEPSDIDPSGPLTV